MKRREQAIKGLLAGGTFESVASEMGVKPETVYGYWAVYVRKMRGGTKVNLGIPFKRGGPGKLKRGIDTTLKLS